MVGIASDGRTGGCAASAGVAAKSFLGRSDFVRRWARVSGWERHGPWWCRGGKAVLQQLRSVAKPPVRDPSSGGWFVL